MFLIVQSIHVPYLVCISLKLCKRWTQGGVWHPVRVDGRTN